MRIVCLAVVILSVLGGHIPASPARAGGLLAEDLSAAPHGVSWTGCHAGGHIGEVWGTSNKWIPRTPGAAFDGVSLGGHSVDGVIGGVQAGCDYQLANGVVLGAGGTYVWTNVDGTHPSARETGVFYHSEVEALAARL